MELCWRARRAVETESAAWVAKPRLAAISEQALRMGGSSSTTRTRRGGSRSVSILFEGAELEDGQETGLGWLASATGRADGSGTLALSGYGLGLVTGWILRTC